MNAAEELEPGGISDIGRKNRIIADPVTGDPPGTRTQDLLIKSQ